MKTTTAKRLHDALGACREIDEYTAGMTLDQYVQDRKTRRAVERCFEIVGEALHLAAIDDETLLDRVPDLRRPVGLRNRIIHGYDTISDEIVWDIVVTKVPILMVQISTLLEEAG